MVTHPGIRTGLRQEAVASNSGWRLIILGMIVILRMEPRRETKRERIPTLTAFRQPSG